MKNYINNKKSKGGFMKNPFFDWYLILGVFFVLFIFVALINSFIYYELVLKESEMINIISDFNEGKNITREDISDFIKDINIKDREASIINQSVLIDPSR